jgi:diguanylate cyclase (GGDEF)-like protein
MERQFMLGAQSVAVAVSKLIYQDLDGYRNFLDSRDVNTRYYKHMQNCLNEIQKSSTIRFIHTINRLDDDYAEIILDSEPLGSGEYSPPGSKEKMTGASRLVFSTKAPAMLDPTESAFGRMLGGNAPILDERGELLGVVAVSIDHGKIFSAVQQLFITLSLTFLLLLAFIYFLLLRVSHLFLEPMLKDKLTGAYNRRYFESILQNGIDASLKSSQNLSILMLDLDHFKKINDTYGHLFGDVVLAKTAGLIRDRLRKDDFFVRYGGEEFIIMFFNLKTDIALMLAERIRKAIEDFEIYNATEKINVKITISIGVANLMQRNLKALELIAEADKAMYKAKETRNAVAMLP